MTTNLKIDDQLIHQAVELGGHQTKKAAVNQALTDYVSHLNQERVTDLFGTIDYDSDYNYQNHTCGRV